MDEEEGQSESTLRKIHQLCVPGCRWAAPALAPAVSDAPLACRVGPTYGRSTQARSRVL